MTKKNPTAIKLRRGGGALMDLKAKTPLEILPIASWSDSYGAHSFFFFFFFILSHESKTFLKIFLH